VSPVWVTADMTVRQAGWARANPRAAALTPSSNRSSGAKRAATSAVNAAKSMSGTAKRTSGMEAGARRLAIVRLQPVAGAAAGCGAPRRFNARIRGEIVADRLGEPDLVVGQQRSHRLVAPISTSARRCGRGPAAGSVVASARLRVRYTTRATLMIQKLTVMSGTSWAIRPTIFEWKTHTVDLKMG
jgi:hypothetical protein